MPAILQFPQINPFVFRIGPVGLSWYAAMYVIGFILSYFILRWRYRRGFFRLPDASAVSLLVTYCFYGLILGARIFYVLVYNPKFYFENPLEIPAIWHGGMSFHGGLIGCIIAMWLFGRRMKLPFLHVADNVGLCAPQGLFFGRIGNFINGELYGRAGDAPWVMVFPRGGPEPRHPSQLYEALLEGLVLSAILFAVGRRRRRDGIIAGLFVLLYGIFRFFVEYYREPDPQLGLLLGGLSMGQLWCLATSALGLVVLWFARKNPAPA